MTHTTNNEGLGVVKLKWLDIRDRIKNIDTTFCALVDSLSPHYPIYLAHYRYGDVIGDTQSVYLPSMNKTLFALKPSEPEAKDLYDDLGYGEQSLPFGMVLSKCIQYYVDRPKEHLTLPSTIKKAGDFFPLSRFLRSKHNYAPHSIFTATAGARSCFMLPSIGNSNKHQQCQRQYHINTPTPKRHYDHFSTFKAIAQSPYSLCKWKTEIMYFSRHWEYNIKTNPHWSPLKQYLIEKIWQQSHPLSQHKLYNYIFSTFKQQHNLKPNPYIADTAKHLFNIVTGDANAYAPAINDDALPLKCIQQAYTNTYGLTESAPIIMQPTLYNAEKINLPVYYSLQHPSTFTFSPKSSAGDSILSELRELAHITRIYQQAITAPHSLCNDTVMQSATSGTQFDFYHTKWDPHGIAQPPQGIFNADNRYIQLHTQYPDTTPPVDAAFFRGCVRLSSDYNDAKAC